MLQLLVEKLKHFIVTFRVSILVIFSALFIVGMLSLILIAHYRLANSTEAVAFKLMGERSLGINKKIDSEVDAVKSEAQYAAYLLGADVQNANDLAALEKATYGFLKTKNSILPSVQSAFWGNEKGDSVRSMFQSDGSITSQVITFNQSLVTHKITHDTQNNISTQKSISTKEFIYDPRQRPWYTDAKTAKQTITTDLYRYIGFGTPAWVVTVAAPAYKNGELLGVFGLHLRIDFFRHFIESIPISAHGVIFIVTDDGRLVAFPKLVQFENPVLKTINSITIPGVSKSFAEYKQTGKKEFYFIDNNNRYLAAYNLIQTFGQHNWLIGIIVPEADFIGDITRTSFIISIIGLAILLVGIFIISRLATQIVKPLQQLTQETENIKNFEIGEKIILSSRIKEIILLTNALNAMKKGLRSFQKYVPAKLVREILEAGDDAKVGGAKREIVAFFSDIKGFSGVSEKTEPEILMPHLCHYFDEVSQIIQRQHGTIDKYIGDAVMAFWGAPHPIDDPCHHAARSALACNIKLSELNKIWQQKGLPILTTRIGLNVGDAIIGNLGASDRLNYTAIGDTVNIASRLQDSNKIYGTNILVSSEVYEKIKHDFKLRMVDYVLLKGKTDPGYIYELMAEKNNSLPFDSEHYIPVFEDGFKVYQNRKWNKAILHFQHCIKLYPADKVALLLIKRCEYCQLNPPLSTWRGEWSFGWEK